jgi:hypothetical protein
LAVVVANAALQISEFVGMPEARIVLAQVTTYLASCPKSNAAYLAIDAAWNDAQNNPTLPVPLHIRNAPTNLMKEMNLKPKDYSFAVFQQPYGFAPFAIGERLGFTKEQIEPGAIATMIGDCGAASSLLGLVHVLDQAKKGQRIFLASYGFGAGSDALSLDPQVTCEGSLMAILVAMSGADILAGTGQISESDRPLQRTEAARMMKSCTAPASTAPTRIQIALGSTPHCAASTGPMSGPAPEIAAK